jgi:hypothetical protein
MRNKFLIVASILAIVSIQGCATKTFGRQGELTSFERESMTCREIALESAKVNGFISQVNTESAFSGKDVLAFLGDFGIGNNLERSAALESASRRLTQLDAARLAKDC